MANQFGDLFGQLGTIIAAFMFLRAIIDQYFPNQTRTIVEKTIQRISTILFPYIQITFHEFTGERLMRSEAYTSIETYLTSISSKQATKLKGHIVKNSQSLILSMDDQEQVFDEFEGVKIWWASGKNISKTQTLSFQQVTDEKRYYKLKFHNRNRELVLGPYLNHVLKEGKAIQVKNRQRNLFTNSGSTWSHVPFEHPATFETLAIDPEKKREIIDDLQTFSKAGDFYSRIGRSWKRGYLLYGPPGTGKSTMIAAIANLLGYDIYDLELTSVKDNTELKKLLIAISSKSIIVIEDIDCSTDFTANQRNKKGKAEELKDSSSSSNKVLTLSGLLNFIDGLWSACGGERLIVFTTNYVENLDPALIRKGRMDKHIELSYCGFDAFKVLAKNYVGVDEHRLFPKIGDLLEEVEMTPADVAEWLMPKTVPADPENCLESLVSALEEIKKDCGTRKDK